MVACCAHHLADLVPLVGAAGVAPFLFEWRIPLMALGLVIIVAVTVVDAQTWTSPSWEGAGPGGHHREGTLRFTATGLAQSQAVLTIDGLDEAVTAQLTLPEGT